LRIIASEELRERATMLSIGRRQMRINKKQTKAMIQSPIRVLFDLIMLHALSFVVL
jgi:hypothetical protein